MRETTVSRRTFLKGSAATAALACAAGSISLGSWQAERAAAAEPAVTVTAPSLCNGCSSKCGLIATTVDGQLWTLKGNEVHPYSKGRICGRGHGLAQMSYSDERVTQPLRRKDDGTFEPIDWDTAFKEIGAKVQDIIAKNGPESLAIIQDPRPSGKQYSARFMNALGSANVYAHSSSCNLSKESAYQLTIGATGYSNDFANAKMVMFIGRSYGDGIRPSSVPSSVLLSPLQKIMLPVVWFFNQITLVFMRIFGIKSPVIQGNAVSKEELRTIVNESKSKLSQRNQNMLISILDLEKVTIGDIMVPRNEIFGIDVNDEWKSIVRQLTHSPHGRIVLYRDTLDDVIGMLRVREAYRLMTEKKEFTKQILIKAADKIYFIPESTPLSLQLVNFQRNNEKAGIVVDEYGEIQGLVTVEDILEEIVGDFTTSMSPSLAEEVIPQKDGSLLVDGTTNIRDINKAFACHLPENEARTINGVIIEELGDLPVVGAKITIDGYEFEVLEVQDNVIKKALIRHLTPSRH